MHPARRWLGHAYPGEDMKICHEWTVIEYIECVCPYCHTIDTHFPVGRVGDVVRCVDCEKEFKLGEQE